MSWALRRSETSIDDLSDIWDYIAADNAAAVGRRAAMILHGLTDLTESDDQGGG